MFLARTIFGVKEIRRLNTPILKSFFSQISDFKTKYPVLYSHVHPDYKKLFDGKSIDSSTVVKWVCDKGPDHVWESDLATRIRFYKRRNDFVCLYCCGKRVSVTNSLATRYPSIQKEWLYEKNDGLKPTDVTCHSCREVWWQCPNHPEHQYIMTPNDRTLYNQGCPFCSQSMVTSEQSLAHLFPEIAAQWDQERNGYLKPTQVRPNYSGKVWWTCSENPEHHWKSSVAYRTRRNCDCPYCKEKKKLGNNIISMNPVMMQEWNHEKNGDLRPDEISITSSRRVWWKCKHGFEWKQSIVYRNQALQLGRYCCEQCQEEFNNQTVK